MLPTLPQAELLMVEIICFDTVSTHGEPAITSFSPTTSTVTNNVGESRTSASQLTRTLMYPGLSMAHRFISMQA